MSDIGGEDLAAVKVFKDISPAVDGKLHLKFLADRRDALDRDHSLRSGRLRPVRLCATGRFLTIAAMSGCPKTLPTEAAYPHSLAPYGTGTPTLFQDERFGHFSYTIQVAPSRYTASLGFAENYHTVGNAAQGAGQRLFNVGINGVLVLRDFEFFESGGALKANTRTFRDIEPRPQDKIVITFEAVTDPAIVHGGSHRPGKFLWP